MFDELMLFSDAQVVTTTGTGTNTLTINKLPIEGIEIELDVTAVSGTGTPTLGAAISNSDSVVIYTFPDMTAVGTKVVHVGSQDDALHVHYTVSGTNPSFTVTCGVVAAGSLNQI
jgi:hypothetical protein